MNGVVVKKVRVGSSRGEPEVDGLGRAFHVTISHADRLSTTNQSIHEQHRIVNSQPALPYLIISRSSYVHRVIRVRQ